MTVASPESLVAPFVALKALLQQTPDALDEKSARALTSLTQADAAGLREFEAEGRRCLEKLSGGLLELLGLHGGIAAAPKNDANSATEEAKEQALESKQSVQILFDQFDLDRDGLISCQEFKEDVLLGLGLGDQMAEDEIDKLVEAADEDKDGFITLVEFTNWLFSSCGKKVMRFATGGQEGSEETRDGEEDEETADDGKSSIEKSLRKQLVEIRRALEQSQSQLAELTEKSARELKVAADKGAQQLKNVQAVLDEEVESTHEFWKDIAKNSASPALNELVSLESAELLGNGKYGIVLKAKSRSDDSFVVIKLMSVRWAHVAAKEWYQGKLSEECALIVGSREAVLHADHDKSLAKLVHDGLESGKIQLPGRRTGDGGKAPTLPDKHLCLFQEFMNEGSVQDWIDNDRLDSRRMLAVMREVAGALAFMHKKGMTHNDVKPENIMLRRDDDSPVLRVKLGDLGIAARSLDRSADFALYGMTVFCMVIAERFGTRKFQIENVDQLIAEISKSVKERLNALSDTPGKIDDTFSTISKLPAQLRKIWGEQVNMAQIEDWPPLRGFTFRAEDS